MRKLQTFHGEFYRYKNKRRFGVLLWIEIFCYRYLLLEQTAGLTRRCFLLFHSEIKNNLVNFFVSSNLPDVFIFNLNGRAWRGTLSSALLNIPPIFSETCDDLRSFIYQPGTRTNQNPRTSNCFHSYSHPGIASVKFHYSATITVTRSF